MADTFTEKEQGDFNYARDVRRMIIDTLTKDGEIPKHPEVLKALMIALNDMDRTALGKARVRISAKSNENESISQALLGEFLRTLEYDDKTTEDAKPRVIEEIPKELQENIDDNALVVETKETNYQRFILDEENPD